MYCTLVKTKVSAVYCAGVNLTVTCNYKYSITYGGSCYFGNDQLLSWQGATDFCLEQSANLAYINSEAENDVVTHVFPSTILRTWIGLNDIAREGVYVWENDNSPASYTKWASGQPDNGQFREDCAELLLAFISVGFTASYWTDRSCFLQLVSVCKRGKWMHF